MPWTIPDKGEGDNDLQSILFQEYLDVLVAGVNGIDCVLWGCGVTGGADMTPAVAAGAVLSNGVLRAVTAGDVTIAAADATNPRIDLIVVTSAGTKAVRTGTAAAGPKPPARAANDVVLAAVYVPALDTSIEQTKCTDMRVMREKGPIEIYKTTTQVLFNNSLTETSVLAVTIPAGCPNGKIIRVRCGGHYLHNSGVPTLTLRIKLGGTTVFQDAVAAIGAEVDRGAWRLEFDLALQGNSDQELVGMASVQTVANTKAAPTTGRAGDLAVTTHANSPISVLAAIDMAAADRVIDVTWQYGTVQNAANEMTLQYGTVELI